MAEDNSWKTSNFRQSVVNKINEAIQQTGMTSSKNGIEMENHVFHKARNKDEYLGFVARLILHVREMNNKHKNQQNAAAAAQQQAQQEAGGNANQQGVGMPDPINALQNLASQGTRPQMMGQMGPGGPMGGQMVPGNASNLLHSLRPQMQMGGMGGGAGMQGNRVGMGPGPGGQMGGMMGPNQMQGPGPGAGMTMSNAVGGPNQMNPTVAMGGGVGAGGGGGAGSGVMGPVPGQMGMAGGVGGGAGPQGNFVGMAGNQMVRKPPDMMPGGTVFPGGGGAVRSVTPNNFLRQSPSPSVPSPVGPGAHGPPSHPGQMIPSPALIPSPNPLMGSVPQRSTIGQSPGASLNTPGQPGGAVPSPLNPQEEQLYREKYRSLTKYIEPLKRMIAKMENDDIDKIAKMKRLLEILSNPSVRIPLETLHKCEAALTSQLGSIRETPTNNPLVEAISSTLQSANGNLTLQRTFRSCLEALYGPDIKNLPPPTKQLRLEEPSQGVGVGATGAGTTVGASGVGGATTAGGVSGSSSSTAQEIPHILQVEIARLDQKFKVSLDQCAISGTKTIKLMIKLDDTNLPCVPPVAVTIPEDYPYTAPSCSLIEQDYNGTPFLILVQKSFMARICKLPGFFTLSHLLDTWEMSVRQACSPNPTIVTPTATSVLLGM
uniref:Mediator of RNA polymerase II transcription subunit 15 n=1 Tax=Anopheles atroparvus TaxID=41427 RepID=A0A182IZN3_ANOAO